MKEIPTKMLIGHMTSLLVVEAHKRQLRVNAWCRLVYIIVADAVSITSRTWFEISVGCINDIKDENILFTQEKRALF